MAFAATMMLLFIALCIALLGSFTTGSTLGTGIFGLTNSATLDASQNLTSTEAFNLAESGVEYTIEWLHNQPAPPGNTTGFAPSLWNSMAVGTPTRSVVNMNVGSTTGSFSVEMYPGSSNGGSTQKKYLIESIGTFKGFQEMVTAYVQQASFGKYAYFTDVQESDNYWVANQNAFDGPMHDNNSNFAGTPGTTPTNIIWYNAANTPQMFRYTGSDAFTCCAPTINWNLNSIGNYVAPSSASDWADLAAGGAGTVNTNASYVPMPTNSSTELNAALGPATAPTSASPSVIIPNNGGTADGGVYIHGPVDNMVLSTANGGTTQNIEVDQTDNTTVPSTKVQTFISMNPSTNQTSEYTITTQGTSTPVTSPTNTYTGMTDGVVYSDSNIGKQSASPYTDSDNAWDNGDYQYGTDQTGGVSGQIADNYYNSSGQLVHTSAITLATSSTTNMNLDGSLTTNTQRLKNSNGTYTPESTDTNFLKNAGTLGMVTNTVEIVDNDIHGNAITNCEVDGSVLAYNTFTADNIYYRPKANFQLVGGYIAKSGGYFGVIDGSGNFLGGFAEHYNYDSRLADNPPPFFPTTGTIYDILSWQRENPNMQL